MRIRIFPILILLVFYVYIDSFAQGMPFVYDMENTRVECPKPPLPLYEQLSIVQSLPDPFAWSDGRGRISSFSDWQCRRAEISEEVQRYELGIKPLPPAIGNIEASFSQGKLTVVIKEGDNTLTLTANIQVPGGTGPFPAVIGVGSGTGSLPSDLFTSLNIATIDYNFGEVAPWTQSGRGMGGFYKLFPDPKVGYFTAWAWGVSRIIDGLELVPEANIDIKHLAITGCSFAGKIALFSGALDERIALTLVQESGGGGDAAWRVTETLSGSRETLANAQSYGWYHQDVKLFNYTVTKLPCDHHEVMAMVAPRALFIIGNPSMEWLAEESGYVACMAAKEVWKALGVPERFGFSKVGGHDHCALPSIQRPEISAFLEKFLLGQSGTNTDISNSSYSTDLSKWITWSTPTLTDKPSFWTQASLLYPENLQRSLETEITFLWSKIKNSEKYYIQLSPDPTFKTVEKSDSTTSDTVRTISGLLDGTKYFWRIQAKNTEGTLGPWSNVSSFSTFIALPGSPTILAAGPYNNRAGFITFKWNKVNNADQYNIQVSEEESFVSIFMSDSTFSDTVKTLRGFDEGKKYFWRVQAVNVQGPGPWSEISNYTLVLAPTNLTLQISGATELTLKWNDRSKVEEGYKIERMQGTQSTFSVLDTLIGSGTEYIDTYVEQNQTYTYRIKAFLGFAESEYSNEASLLLVGVDEQVLPTEFSISQNFPNPFNPTTKLKFALPIRAFTKLIIYDLLGREIKVLLNEEMEAGIHEIDFDADSFTSGVYFYTIQSGDFVDTKKMVLIR